MNKRHVLIIGASSGLGYECMRWFSKNYNVTGLSRRGLIPDDINKEFALGLACDANNLGLLRSSLEAAVAHFGKISVIVVASGIQKIKPVRSFKPEEVLDLLSTNIMLPFNVASLFASQKFCESNAVLCLVSSISATKPEPGIVLYGATKAAVESLVSGLAKELAPRRVVGVSPGWLDTPMTQKYSHIYDNSFIGKIKELSPLGMIGITDVVHAIDFMVSENAAKITGQVMIVDAGASL